MAKRILRKVLANALIFLGIVTILPSIALIEFALRRPDRFTGRRVAEPEIAARAERVELRAADGVPLVASLFGSARPEMRRCILLQHGVGSQRLEMPGFIRDFPLAGYSVLSVDARGHGDSGGELVTYGALERDDMRRWFVWLAGRAECRSGVYGLGLSMGAAILLQTLPSVPEVKAAVTESPFASFREIGYDRIGQMLPMLAWLRRPMVELGFVWARAIRGIDFDSVSPLDAAARIGAPVLLIHGTQDFNIAPRHSELILPKLRSGRLWKVEGAQHVGCYGRDPARYVEEVTAWFDAAGGKGAR
jgi:uncharacterized protein